MADTIDVDGNGNPIPHRQTQLQQTSQAARTPVATKNKPKQPKKRRGWKIAKHGISNLMNAVVITGAVLYNSPELPQVIKNSLSTPEVGLKSSPRPVARPTRQP